jgi:hypothetical protein
MTTKCLIGVFVRELDKEKDEEKDEELRNSNETMHESKRNNTNIFNAVVCMFY